VKPGSEKETGAEMGRTAFSEIFADGDISAPTKCKKHNCKRLVQW
jgi:hypothetical protein